MRVDVGLGSNRNPQRGLVSGVVGVVIETTEGPWRISFGGGKVGLSEPLTEETRKGSKEFVLTTLERMGMWKRIPFVGNLCLRGKV